MKLLAASIICLVLVAGGSCRNISKTESSVSISKTQSGTVTLSQPRENIETIVYEVSTSATDIESFHISIQPVSGSTFAPGISVTNLKLSFQSADSFMPGFYSGVTINRGDKCLAVSGFLNNVSGQPLQVSYLAEGFNAAGKQVAWTLDSGPIVGVLATIIPAGSSTYFGLHLNWTPEISVVRVRGASYTNLAPLP